MSARTRVPCVAATRRLSSGGRGTEQNARRYWWHVTRAWLLLLCLCAAACAPASTPAPASPSPSEARRTTLPPSAEASTSTPATARPQPTIATPPDGCATGFRVRSGTIVVRITERIGPFPVHEAVIEG